MYVLLIVLLVVFLIALIRVRFVLEYNGDGFRGFVGIYPVKMFRFPKREKQDRRKEKKLSKKKTDLDADKEKKSYGSLKEFTWTVKPILKTLGKLVRMITVKKITVDVRLSGENAASTALLYGEVCAGVSAVFPILDGKIKIKKKKIDISPDFQASESTISLYANMYLRVWKLVVIGVFLLYQLLNKKRTMDKKKGIEEDG